MQISKIKKLLKNILCIILTLFLTLSMVNLLGVILRPTDTDKCIRSIDTFHSLQEDSLDVIVYGSSHAWRGFDTNEFYNNYGYSIYNYGCNWQHINTTELFIEDSFRTQKPKVIFVETFLVNSILDDEDIDGEIYYTRAIKGYEIKKEYLKWCFGDDIERYLSYYMPLCAFHSNWSSLNEISLTNIDNYDFLSNKGFVSTSGVEEVTIGDYESFEQSDLKEDSYYMLDKIVNVCNENNTKVVFYTVPYSGEFKYGDALKEYADENDCYYVNMFEHMEDVGIDPSTDFSDESHLNTSGAKKVADYLGQYIVENNIID